MLLHDFIGKIGAGFESQTLGETEGIVAVEKNVLDLNIESAIVSLVADNKLSETGRSSGVTLSGETVGEGHGAHFRHVEGCGWTGLDERDNGRRKEKRNLAR